MVEDEEVIGNGGRGRINFSQPIRLRFNGLMTGAKPTLPSKLYGEDMTELYAKAKEAAKYVEQVPGLPMCWWSRPWDFRNCW